MRWRCSLEHTRKWRFLWPILFISSMLLVTILLLVDLPPSESHWPYLDKIEHAFVFGVLIILGGLAYPCHAAKIMMMLVIYGGLMEIMQPLVTMTREGSLFDWFADITGLLVWFPLRQRLTSRVTS